MAVQVFEVCAAMRPVRVSLELPLLLRAGLLHLLSGRVDEVVLLSHPHDAVADVVMFDPSRAAPDPVRMAPLAAQRIARVAVLTDDRTAGVTRARALGATEVVSVDAGPDELIDVLRRARAGHPRQASPSLSPVGRPTTSGPEPLSSRESEVLALVCRGLSNAEISEELFLSLNTIKTYIRSSYRKIGVTRRAQAVLWGLAHGVSRGLT